MQPDSSARTKPLSMFVLAMMNTAIVVGLEGLPEVGSFGLPLVLYYLIFTLIYFMPVGLVAAELGAGWPGSGGVYQWVKEALGERVAFVAIWCQWVQILIWYPTVLAVCAVSVAYIFDPLLGSSAGFILAVSLAVFWFATLSNFRGLRASGFLTTLFLYAGTFVPVLLAIGLAGWWLASGREPAIDLSVGAIVPEIESVGDFVGILAIFSFLSGLEVNAVHFNKVRDPQRSIALSILISGVLVLSVSVLGALSVAVMVPVGGIDLAAGTLQVFDRVLGELGVGWLVPFIAFLALAGMLGTHHGLGDWSHRVPTGSRGRRPDPAGFSARDIRWGAPKRDVDAGCRGVLDLSLGAGTGFESGLLRAHDRFRAGLSGHVCVDVYFGDRFALHAPTGRSRISDPWRSGRTVGRCGGGVSRLRGRNWFDVCPAQHPRHSHRVETFHASAGSLFCWDLVGSVSPLSISKSRLGSFSVAGW